MSKKNRSRPDGLVYSTNQDYMNEQAEDNDINTLPKEQQKLRVILDTKHRRG